MAWLDRQVIYLSGKKIECSESIGVMLSFNVGKQSLRGHSLFAADNGCFAAPEKYTNDGFLLWLDKLDRAPCLFAVAPDIVGNAEGTRERAYPVLPRIRRLGFKAAYVCQDGEKNDCIYWDELDAIFIGGSTEWKLSQAAGDIASAAKQKGKWVHMGRVNSFKRMRLAAAIGCDSCDGTYLAFEPNNRKGKIKEWINHLQRQPLLRMV
tara:strand:- start:793 stop:1416 length:624 start_codon:yes stop_codon:yes gene_type:complete